jgi:hypothetical protein
MIISEFLIQFLSIKGVLIHVYNSPPFVSIYLGLKDVIYMLLLFKEEIIGLLGCGDIAGIKNLTHILRTCLVHKLLMPIVIELFVFQCGEQSGVLFINIFTEQCGRRVF